MPAKRTHIIARERVPNNSAQDEPNRKHRLDRAFSVAYKALVDMASEMLRKERPDHPMQSIDLVHEAYLRLLHQRLTQWDREAQLLGLARKMMRRILIDCARSGLYAKRGGGVPILSLEEALTKVEPEQDGKETNDCLESLAAINACQAQIVILRCIRGFTGEEIARALGISSATVNRQWHKARAWLRRHYYGQAMK